MSLTYHNYVCECGCGELVLPGSRFVNGHIVNLNNPMKDPFLAKKHGDSQRGKTLRELGHKLDCRCFSCKWKRGEISKEEHRDKTWYL